MANVGINIALSANSTRHQIRSRFRGGVYSRGRGSGLPVDALVVDEETGVWQPEMKVLVPKGYPVIQ